MEKKTLLFKLVALVAAMMCALGASAAEPYDFMVDGIAYLYDKHNANEVGVAPIDEYYGGYNGDVVVPPSVTNEGITYQVTRVRYGAFYASSGTVTLPNTITTIEPEAFGSSNYTHIELPNSLQYIGDYAFNGNYLNEIDIPNNVYYVGAHAFDCSFSLETVTIGSGCQTIGEKAFDQCRKLTTSVVMR